MCAGQEQAHAQQGLVTKLAEQDALDITALIDAAVKDTDTIKYIAKVKNENADEIAGLKEFSKIELLNEMKGALDEMKELDLIFKDPVKALEIMIAENLIPAGVIMEKYKKEPKLLETDTKRALYFNFISMAVAAGYL